MKPASIRVSEGARLRELAASVINQAVRDLTHKRKPFEKRLEVLLWLTGPDFEIWADFAGAGHINPYKLLPRLGKAQKRLKGK